jgi:hypothetical protein
MEKGQAVDDPLFPQFGNLPKEIRLEIWEAALPGPRIVELREKPLKIAFGDFRHQVQYHKINWEQRSNQSIDGSINEAPTARILRENSWLDRMNQEIFMNPNLLSSRHLTPMTGFKSYCRAPDILFACRESHEVAIKHYERAFDMVASHPETWFDFHRDVLYIRWDKFTFNRTTVQFDDLRYYIPCTFNEEVRGRIENLAILMDKKNIRNYGEKNLEKFLSCILCHFDGVKTLTLVAKHVGDYPGSEADRNRMELSLLDPIDTDCLELCHRWGYSEESWSHKMQLIYGIPELNIDWLRVDLAELQRLSMSSFAVPKIEYKVVVPGSYLPFLDWMEENVWKL